MLGFVKQFRNPSKRYLNKIKKVADKIDQLSNMMSQLKDEDFPKETLKLKQKLKNGMSLDNILVEAFALVREASTRVAKITPYYVQLLGAIVLHKGNIAEMKTGEGKTLTAVMPAYLNALRGDSVHIVTVNEYLARREAEGVIGDIFRFLGLSVGLNLKNKSIREKKIAYNCDILYSTNSEIGFDYLRDNMESNINNVLMTREYGYVIIDEVDSILIDEARTPLIISNNVQSGLQFYRDADRFAKSLKSEHYLIDLESKTIELTEEGIRKAELFFKINNLYSNQNSFLLHFIKNALKACFVMEKDKDYLVQEHRIVIIDQFTGRALIGRQFSDGLHQALEAKENCIIKAETETSAMITYQNLFRNYKSISGMTGTAKTEEKEFISIYNMKVIQIPTNKKMIREDAPDLVFLTLKEKWKALIEEIKIRHAKKQPILIGTVSVEVSEQISKYLKKNKISHEILNAKNHLKESEIIAKAGQKGAVTIATNMAGRGTDIRLAEGVAELGGLAVLGTERHEVRRIDNQLRGRSGRQGDPGYTKFFVSAEDDLIQRFGSDKVSKLVTLLQYSNKQQNNSVSSRFLTNLFTNIQKKIESSNFEYRKFVLKFDSVLQLQRDIIYKQRKEILSSDKIENILFNIMDKTLKDKIKNFFNSMKQEKYQKLDQKSIIEELIKCFEINFFPKNILTELDFQDNKQTNLAYSKIESIILNKARHILELQKKQFSECDIQQYFNIIRLIILKNIDIKFQRHINDMDLLRRSINFLSYGQQNTLIVYQQEGQKFFNRMIKNISQDITKIVLKSNFFEDLDLFHDLNSIESSQLNDKPKMKTKKYIKKPWD
ncbi:MAG: preprotein translocase subunit SecA [Pigeon pea little leaf phytoplasma]|uniref:Protein translocase subunit SecA n=1 Tax=Candidatus Phytoplasma fabacearum TaxID=2982628 RepID=A0ABU8ZSJ4_9MOLU|nr:preprotein translocase subunit SecA ['Bituminaria bituminosa' little leaf phytoplasma]MDV3148771.1 preprotein translocase subunit SecA [Pigeon pea little leaf phytoplasma]MDO7983552.1 preprotein translocase subunit SecA ['Bituminaria bituminosa' little leaf phytoplasma]MDO8023956.1 preprotein translocase subunit SecA ['Bituminaria bituminosa' little leaf phytoplasma]MDO8030676.1 preprotein translocase subunit SecA ['Bituminaria bituminosa' little leaf phytoplasma]MDV3154060.1 preprotein tra